jgi:branched-chain amino acid transport system permease protein
LQAFVQYAVNGLAIGGVYALVAIGFVIIFRVVRIVNLAQGDFLAVGALAFLALAQDVVPLPLAVAGAVVASIVAGLITERISVQRNARFDELRAFLLTLASSQLIQGTLLLIFGTQYLTLPASAPPILTVGSVHLNAIYLIVIALVVVVLVGLVLFLGRTPLGWAMLATADDPLAARLCAVPVRTMGIVAFGLAALIAGIGGAAYGAASIGSWSVGTTLATAGFAAAVLGGMSDPVKAAIGGFTLGVLQSMVSGYVSSYLQDPITFVFLVVVLLGGTMLRAPRARRVRVAKTTLPA